LNKVPRFRFACEVCERLGISDPVSWINNTPPKVLDLWIALEAVRAKEKSNESEMMTPEEALERLNSQHG